MVLKAGAGPDPSELEAELVALVRAEVGAVAAFRRALVVERLPKTRSGKILRATMRAITDGRDYAVPSTIDDPAILDEIAAAWSARQGELRSVARVHGILRTDRTTDELIEELRGPGELP